MSSLAKKSLFEKKSVKLKTVSLHEAVVGGQKIIQAVVPTDSFLKSDIPNNANSRGFTGNKNKSVAEMIKTLKTEPELFEVKNLGIRMVATDYIRNGDDITIFFDEDEGIFNGGHTYEVLKRQGRSNAYVSIKINLSVPKHLLADISLALNMSKKLELISQGEKKGAFDWIKRALPEEAIVFKEGDVGEYPVEDVLKVANIFKKGKGRTYSIPALNKSLKNKSAILKENNETQVLEYTRHILISVWSLYKEIRMCKEIINNLPSKFSKNGELLQGPAFVLLFGTRLFTEINNNGIPVWKKGWNEEKALEVCKEISKTLGKGLKKASYSDMKADTIYRDPNFHDKVENIFAKSIL